MLSNTMMATPKWLDTAMYPFDNQTFNLPQGDIHYIDEGSGPVLLFVHGTPTWSFLYREFIRTLSLSYRCIAIDHLGFGLSEKSPNFSGTPEAHAKNLSLFIRELNLQDITLIVHDFGGPIGLAAGIENSDRIKNVVLFNSWLWATKQNEAALKIDKLVKGWLGKLLYLNFNFSPKFLVKQGFADKKNLPSAVHQHYIKPFPDKSSRQSLLQIAKALVGSSDWYQQQWEKLDQLADKNWLILWGVQDQFITTEYLAKWRNRLPQALVQELDCGHFVQEEKSAESIAAIANFLES